MLATAGTKNMFTRDDIIYTYTRKQAIEDGILIDVSNTARGMGFKFPVAITKAVWDGFITPDEISQEYGQSEAGRLWDTLWMLLNAIRNDKRGDGQELRFKVYYLMKGDYMKDVTLKSLCHPGDDLEPVLTIMLPRED